MNHGLTTDPEERRRECAERGYHDWGHGDDDGNHQCVHCGVAMHEDAIEDEERATA